jgi:CheY-like chemotaxis protein
MMCTQRDHLDFIIQQRPSGRLFSPNSLLRRVVKTQSRSGKMVRGVEGIGQGGITIERSVVLVAGVPRSSIGELAPVLDRQKLTVIQVTSIEDAVMYAQSARVELIILGLEPTTMSLEEVVQRIRSQSSASRKASLLVLAEPGSEDNARQLIGLGVNRVMLTVDPPKFIGLQVAELLEIAPRATLRLSTRMLVEVEDGFAEALGAVVNISAAGLLLETDADFEPGQHVIISIDVDPQLEPVAAKAEIVRKTDPGREGIEGIGAQFLSFAGDSQKMLETILGDAFRIPIEEVRTAS